MPVLKQKEIDELNKDVREICQIDVRDENGDTALIRAAREGSYTKIYILSRFEANPYFKNNKGETALSLALKRRDVEIAKFLMDHGAPEVIQNPRDPIAPDMFKMAIDYAYENMTVGLVRVSKHIDYNELMLWSR